MLGLVNKERRTTGQLCYWGFVLGLVNKERRTKGAPSSRDLVCRAASAVWANFVVTHCVLLNQGLLELNALGS